MNDATQLISQGVEFFFLDGDGVIAGDNCPHVTFCIEQMAKYLTHQLWRTLLFVELVLKNGEIKAQDDDIAF